MTEELSAGLEAQVEAMSHKYQGIFADDHCAM